MERLIVGKGGLELHEINKVVRSTLSFAELLRKWKSFGRNLQISEAKLLELERQINLNTLLPLEDLPLEILRLWKAEKGSNATLQAVYNALLECDLLEIAELLETTFFQTKADKSPTLLVQGSTRTVDELLSVNTSQETRERIVTELTKSRQSKPIEIVKIELSPEDPPKFYVARSFSYKSEVDKKMFTADKTRDHVFLLQGITRSELARVVDFRPIDFSGDQLRKVTIQYILSELDQDYDKICGITSKPVHLIQHKDNSFFWMKSSKKLNVIREYIIDDQSESLNEQEMITKIESSSPPFALSIADSPGMGKTVVLANLAFNIMSRNPNAIVLFVALQEFAQQLQRIDSPSQAIEAISSYTTGCNESKQILQEMFKSTSQLFYFFLDGYDEILETKLNVADSFLSNLKYLTNVNVVLTTRPHMKSRLESVFNRLSFEILPFTEANQVEFLTKYWINTHGANDTNMLHKFATQCLKSLVNDMIDKERKIAGIPLQCRMLAEVFAEEAKRASQLPNLRENIIKITSFFEMYKSLVNLKFSRISEEVREKYMNAHVHASIALLFPNWTERFEPNLDGYNDIDENILYSIGLMEKSTNSNTPKFLHRTFAEYILAGFIVKGIGKFGVCIEFLYDELSGGQGTNILKYENGFDDYELKNPVIGYFINAHVQDDHIDESLLQQNLAKANINDEDVCIAAFACCIHNFENFFDLTDKILRQCKIENREDLREKYFRYMPFAAAYDSRNVSLYQKVMKFTKHKFGVDINYHVFIDKAWKTPCTPLHFALLNWNYNVVSFLLNEYKNEILGIRGLLHCCVAKSVMLSDSLITEKLATIDLLLRLNPEWLTDNINGRVPILSLRAHVKLLQRLVERGANINTYSSKSGTILHLAAEDGTQSDNFRIKVRWALDTGFNLINERNENGLTCLMAAIHFRGVIDDDVLQWFHKANADMNARDKDGDSVLHYAVRYSNNVDFIGKLIDYGGDVRQVNNKKETLAHYIIRYVKDPDVALTLLELLESKGFKKFNNRNIFQLTPLEVTQELRSTDVQLIDYFNARKSTCSFL